MNFRIAILLTARDPTQRPLMGVDERGALRTC